MPTRATNALRKTSTARSIANPLPMLPRLIRTPSRSNATVRSLRIELQVVPAGPSPGVRQRNLVRHMLGPFHKPPRLGKRARRHIIGTAGLSAEADCHFQQLEEPPLDLHRTQMGRRIQPTDLGIVAVDRHLGFEYVRSRPDRGKPDRPRRAVDAGRRTSKYEPIAGRWTRIRS